MREGRALKTILIKSMCKLYIDWKWSKSFSRANKVQILSTFLHNPIAETFLSALNIFEGPDEI